MRREYLGRIWVVVTLGALFVASACYSGLNGLAPFPCAEDGTCPAPLECYSATKQCGHPITCSNDDAGLFQVDCAGTCTSTFTDPNNCGACGATCGADAGPGSSCCEGTCADLQTDDQNCGACGNTCAGVAGETCVNGACGCPCGLTVCGSTCVDLQADPANCGTCGTACPVKGETCSSGTCTCAPPNTTCGDTCTDTSTDSSNCGKCGTVCPGDETCAQGVCTSSCVLESGSYAPVSTPPALPTYQGVCSAADIQAFVTACGSKYTRAACDAWLNANVPKFGSNCSAGTACGTCIFTPNSAWNGFYGAMYAVPPSQPGGLTWLANYPACVWAEAQTNGEGSGAGEACAVALADFYNCDQYACGACSSTAYSSCLTTANGTGGTCQPEQSSSACQGMTALTTCTPAGTSTDSDPDWQFIVNLFCGTPASSGSSSGSSSGANSEYPCDPPSGPQVCGLPYGSTHAFFGCSQQSDCVSGTVCVDNDGDGVYYCKPLCKGTSGSCEQYVSTSQCNQGPGGGGACTIALCPNGASSGIPVCEGAGTRLAPSYSSASCCQ